MSTLLEQLQLARYSLLLRESTQCTTLLKACSPSENKETFAGERIFYRACGEQPPGDMYDIQSCFYCQDQKKQNKKERKGIFSKEFVRNAILIGNRLRCCAQKVS